MALLANINRDKRKRARPFLPADLNPLLAKRVKKTATGIIAAIASEFLPASKQGQMATLRAARARAHETGDWSEFKKLAEGINGRT